VSNEGEPDFSGRLAFREQGQWWIAYWARLDTMDGATELARVRMVAIMQDPILRQQFINFCKATFDVVVREALGTTPLWPKPPTPARD
jgi:hypothetical protein